MSYLIELNRHIRYENLQGFDSSGLLFGIEVDHFRDDMTDYFLSSPHLDLEETEDIPHKAEALGILINGIFEIFEIPEFLQLRSHRLLRKENLQFIANVSIHPPSREFLMPYSGLYREWPTWKRSAHQYLEGEKGNFCILCLLDDRIRNIALTLGYLGINWISLSSIMEHLGYSESEMARRYEVDLGDIKLLKRTANSFEVLGPAARHGQKGFEPPKEPMRLIKAKEITLKMIRIEAILKSKEAPFKQFVGQTFCG